MRNSYKILVGKPEGKRPLRRHKRRWEDNIKIDLRETGLVYVELDGCGSGEGPVAGCCVHGNEASGSTKVGKFLE
jgi:hypothetical protein